MPSEDKESISVTIDSVLLKWIDEQIEEHRFASRSHAIEYCVSSVKEDDAEE
jgi:Arc/MetJ-type ribon-helix-helix transcriptional regulator